MQERVFLTVKAIIRGKFSWMLVGSVVAYTLVHFAFSGVRYPLQALNFGPVEEELAPLTEHLSTGKPVQSTNVRQYGPVFFLVMHPLVKITGGDRLALSHWLYAIQLVSIALAFLCCLRSMEIWLRRLDGPNADRRLRASYLALLLGLVWFNFSPMYSILAGRNVEMWELCLISAALYLYLRHWRFGAAFCIAAATLIKALPIVFLLYFVLRDRRTLAYTIASFGVLLSVAQLLYGSQMGYGYFPFMLSTAVGQTHALGFYENIGIKSMVVKALTGWRLLPGGYFAPIEGQRLLVANALGHVLQVTGVLWSAWALMRFQRRPDLPGVFRTS